ncbi:MAG: nuclear transport factor 2 family protein [bacterium]|nr:nuclear transport factor 2 family protein [bacterium]
MNDTNRIEIDQDSCSIAGIVVQKHFKRIVGDRWTLCTTMLLLLLVVERNVLATENPIESLIQAERSFSAMSERAGVSQSFQHWFADSCIVLRPHPTNGKNWYKDREIPVHLSWEPNVTGVSVSGEFGYSSGPWLMKKSAFDTVVTARGHFVSIWKKTTNGEWQVAFDHGISYESPFDAVPLMKIVSPKIIDSLSQQKRLPQHSARLDSLLKRDRQFHELLRSKGTVFAYENATARKVLMLREGFTPVYSYMLAEQFMRKYGVMSSLTPLGGDVAESDDLGYTYGKLHYKPRKESDSLAGDYYYLRVWQRNHQWRWQIVLEIATPIPPERIESSSHPSESK